MNRWPVALLLALTCASSAAAQAWNKKLNDFRTAAYAERKKLGLDRDAKALFAKYPTPEVTFSVVGTGSAGAGVLCPGETLTLKVDGALQPGTLVVVQSDDVEVVKESFTPKGWEATVRASKTATPATVDVQLVAPVSLAVKSVQALVLGCEHTWTVEANGDTLVLKTKFAKDSYVTATGEWRRGGKALGPATYRVTSATGSLSLYQEQSAADQQTQMKVFQQMMTSPEMKAVEARTQAASKKLDACGKLPPEKMGPCFAGPQKELEAVNKDREALMAKAELAAAPAHGCRQLNLVLKGGAITGDAEACAGKRPQERVTVSGRYTAP